MSMSMSVLVNMNEMIMNGTKSVVYSAIMEISRVYNFDGEEACRMLELNPMESKSVKAVKSVKSVKSVKAVKSVKSSLALPFNGERDVSCCQGLRQNHGLYTQCQSGRMNGGEFCKNCQSQCDKNGRLEYGSIGDRMKAHEEGVEFKDPSGKSPTAYSIVMKKLKLTREQVEEEAGKLNIIINPIHFEEVAAKKSGRPAKADKQEKTESKQKGRPKKSKKVLELAGEEEDLFASLVMSANKTSEEEMSSDEEDKKTVIMSDSEDDEAIDKVVAPSMEETLESVEKPVEKPVEKQKKKVISEAERLEKEQKKQALEAEKEAKKQALEAEKEAKKQALEAEKEAKRQTLEAEKEAKKQALEAEKEAKKQALEAEKAKKELAKQQKEVEKQKKPKKEEAKPAAQVEDEEEADVVNKIEFEGKKYLRSKKTGIVYNMEQDVVGKWNVEKKRVDFNVEEEESEEEYEDDN